MAHLPAASPVLRFGAPRVRLTPRRALKITTLESDDSSSKLVHGLFRPRRGPLHVVGTICLDATVVAAVLALTALGIGPHFANYRTLTMLTASMRPAYPPGSIVVVTEEPVSTLKPGDVITFHAPTPNRPVVTHRVVTVEREGAATRVTTRGDANNAADPWGEFAINSATVWRARGEIPLAGHAIANLRRPEVQLVLTRALPLTLLAWLLVSVWRRDDAATA